tara:strand:- start:187 stop:540 length:354 start_codon:yes stop_codon:yes gene_type:complete
LRLQAVLFEITLQGNIGTKSSHNHEDWKSRLESKLQFIPSSLTKDKRLSVTIQAWISADRLHGFGRNDVDNIAKTTLDSITRSGLIRDDSIIYDLHVTKYATDGPEQMILSAQEWIC